MKKLLFAYSLLLVLVKQDVFSQEPVKCLTDEYMQEIYLENPAYEDSMEAGFQKFHVLRKKFHQRNAIDTIVIPVHFIIVHKPGEAIGEGDNFSNARILSQLEVLNKDFARRNADTFKTPPVFPVGDTGIRFCLAAKDPNGNPTTGITRFATTLNFRANELNIKNQTRWPREDYLNIWVANMGDTLGFAYIPTPTVLPNEILDGLIVTHNAFGGPGFAPPGRFGLGRTATHEAGHYFGLRHIWRNSGCNQDDGIEDTPLQDEANYFCPTHPSPSCDNNGDMFMNYMDYTDDACMNAFTIGQGDYMRHILNTSRFSIKFSAARVCEPYLPLKLASVEIKHPRCHLENNGEITVVATGGRAPFTYQIGTEQNTSGVFSGLPAGKYSIVVKDALDVTDTIQLELINPPALVLNLTSKIDNQCFGQNNGSIRLRAAGGTGNYIYTLNGNNNSIGLFENLPNGQYSAIVTDENLCSSSLTTQISSPSEIKIDLEMLKWTSCPDSEDGMIKVVAMGGAGAFTYKLSDHETNQSGIFSNLAAGSYLLTVKDDNKCEKHLEVSINSPPPITLDHISKISPSCFNTADGSIEVFASGGTPPLYYRLNNNDHENSPIFKNLRGGAYQVVIADSSKCEKDTIVTLVAPDSILVDYEILMSVECHGQMTGSVNLIPRGGISPYQFIINGIEQTNGSIQGISSGLLRYEIKDHNNCVANGNIILEDNSPLKLSLSHIKLPGCHDSSDGEIRIVPVGAVGNVFYKLNGRDKGNESGYQGLDKGVYSVVAVDDRQCPTVLDIILDAPDELNAIYEISDLKCHNSSDGSVALKAVGGTAPYRWTFQNEIEKSGDEVKYDGLNAGIYQVVLEDAKNCRSLQSIEIIGPEPLKGGINVLNHDDCHSDNASGVVSIFAYGGTAPYLYSYDGQFASSGLFQNLIGGFYTFMVKDQNDCSIILSEYIPKDNDFQLKDLTIEDISCFGAKDGRIEVNLTGGSGDFLIRDHRADSFPEPLLNYDKGWHRVSIIDRISSCTQEIYFYIKEPDDLSIDYEYKDDDNQVGVFVIDVQAKGGTAPYLYSLDDGPYQTSYQFTGVLPGWRKVSVQDNNGCEKSIEFLIVSTSTPHFYSKNLRIYPNPANSVIYVENSKLYHISNIKILNHLDTQLSALFFEDSQINDLIPVEVSHLPAGIYFLIIDTYEQRLVKPFVKF